MKSPLSFIIRLSQKYSYDEMSVYAAQASFFTILAAFPFFMLLLALIDLIPIVQVSDLLAFLIQALPDNLDALTITIIDNIRNNTTVTLLSLSALTAIWSASKGILSMERGLNRAYDVDVQRNYVLRRLLCSGYTFLFTFMCALSLLFLVFGSMIEHQIVLFFPELGPILLFIPVIRGLLSLALLSLFFLAFYVVLPHKKQKIRSQIPGALFSAVGWITFSYAFSFYFKRFNSFTPIYGSLTAVILMMLWLYFCICILFLGAELNSLLDQ